MKKIVSIIVITSMLFAVAACGNGSTQSGSVGSAETSVENNEVASDSDQNTEDANVQSVNGMYTYTLYEGTEYEMTLSMDVNVDDYIMINDNGQFFKISQLAYDYGWIGVSMDMDSHELCEFTEAVSDIPGSYQPSYYIFRNDDLTTRFSMERNDEDIPNAPTINGQIAYLWASYHSVVDGQYSDYYTADDIATNRSHRLLTVEFANHYSDCDYRLIGEGWYLSYNDIVLLSYIFWAESVNPGNNPLVEAVGVDVDYCRCDSFSVEYDLP